MASGIKIESDGMVEISKMRIETDIAGYVDARRGVKKSIWHLFRMDNYTWVFRVVIGDVYYQYLFLDDAFTCYNSDGFDNRNTEAKNISEWDSR